MYISDGMSAQGDQRLHYSAITRYLTTSPKFEALSSN